MVNIGGKEGQGIQVFTTLATVRRSNKKVDVRVKELLTDLSFDVIHSDDRGEFSSNHLTVAGLWATNHIQVELRKLNPSDSSTIPNPLAGDTIPQDKEGKNQYPINILSGKSESERTKVRQEYLNQAYAVREATTQTTMRAAFKKGLNGFIPRWKSLIEHSLKPDTDIEGIEETIDELDELLKETKVMIKALKKR